MLVTHSLLERVKTLRGGYTIAQLRVMGIEGFQKGWKAKVIGKDVSDWRVLFYERNKSYEKRWEEDLLKVNAKRKKGKSGKKSIGNLDVTYSETWERRNKNLDIPYSEFLKSDHWLATKKKALSRKKSYGSCLFCGSTENLELHHTSYKWIGTKHELCNVISLCRDHHQEVHDYAKSNDVSVRLATTAVKTKYAIMKKNKLGVENSLVNNINAKKKAGTSKPKSKSSVDPKQYAKMKKGWK